MNLENIQNKNNELKYKYLKVFAQYIDIRDLSNKTYVITYIYTWCFLLGYLFTLVIRLCTEASIGILFIYLLYLIDSFVKFKMQLGGYTAQYGTILKNIRFSDVVLLESMLEKHELLDIKMAHWDDLTEDIVSAKYKTVSSNLNRIMTLSFIVFAGIETGWVLSFILPYKCPSDTILLISMCLVIALLLFLLYCEHARSSVLVRCGENLSVLDTVVRQLIDYRTKNKNQERFYYNERRKNY